MAKKKNSSIKGLVFFLVIIAVIGVVLIIGATKPNMTVHVKAYKDSALAEGVELYLNNDNEMLQSTNSNGSATIRLRVKEGDTLIFKAVFYSSETKDTLAISRDRFRTSHATIDFVMDK